MDRIHGTARWALALAMLPAIFLLLPASAASAAAPQSAQADAALRYLYSQLQSDGSIAGALGATEDTVISDADAGFDPATLQSSGASAYGFLAGHQAAITTAGGAAKYVLAWLAAGKPASVGAATLLDKLNTPAASGGFLEPNGAFHNADATVETANAFSQALAVLADLAAGRSLPAHAIGWLVCAQRPGGGFGYTIDDSAATPPESCGKDTSDTNDTAIILQALSRARVKSADAGARAFLHAAQQSGGGFGFSPAGPSDPSSDTIVIQALVAIGDDPTGPAWTPSAGHDPLSDLESFADPGGSGGYVFPGNTTPDAFTTSAVPQALTLEPYGARTSFVAGSSPLTGGTPTPSPSPTSSVSAAGTVPVPATGSSDLPAGAGAAVLATLAGACTVSGAVFIRRRRSTRR